MKHRRKTTYRTGQRAEKLAALYLRFCGWRILKSRFRPPFRDGGEIDLIARKGPVLMAVEVKYRRRGEDLPLALEPRQCDRIWRSLRFFARKDFSCLRNPPDLRLDFIAISPQWPCLRHFRNYQPQESSKL